MSRDAPALHATLVARRLACGWRGALLRGVSGAGKSDLALRALAAGWRLVADDRTLVWKSGPRLFGRAPPTLAGLIEARHLGVAPVASLPLAEIALVVGCAGEADAGAGAPLERLPQARTVRLLQADVAHLRLAAREASALAKLELALAAAAGALTAAELAVSSGRASLKRALREDV